MHQVTIVRWSVRVNDQCIGVVDWTDGKIEISVNRTYFSPEELDALVEAAKTAKASHLKRSVELPKSVRKADAEPFFEPEIPDDGLVGLEEPDEEEWY